MHDLPTHRLSSGAQQRPTAYGAAHSDIRGSEAGLARNTDLSGTAALNRASHVKVATDEVRGDFAFERMVVDLRQELAGMRTERRFGSSRTSDQKQLNTQVAERLPVLARHMVGNRNFTISAGEKVGGLLSASIPPKGSARFPDDGVFIHGIVSRPGTKDIGKEGIKQAILMSKEAGRDGRVHLEFQGGTNSRAVYEHFGFVLTGSSDGPRPNQMTLSPPAANAFMEKYENSQPRFI